MAASGKLRDSSSDYPNATKRARPAASDWSGGTFRAVGHFAPEGLASVLSFYQGSAEVLKNVPFLPWR